MPRQQRTADPTAPARARHGTQSAVRAGCTCRRCLARRKRIAATARAWRRANLAKARAIERTSKAKTRDRARDNSRHTERMRTDAAYRERRRALRAATRCRTRERRQAERTANVEQAIRAAIPAHLPLIVRDDVAQDLAIVYLTTGQITAADVKAAITAFWKNQPVQAGRELSLDAPVYSADGDSRERWIDRLEAR